MQEIQMKQPPMLCHQCLGKCVHEYCTFNGKRFCSKACFDNAIAKYNVNPVLQTKWKGA